VSRFRMVFLITAIAAMAAGLVACGGDDGGDGGGSEDPQKVLDAAFSGDKEDVTSGDLDISLDINVEGDQGGNVSASLSGPFQSEGDDKLPSLDLTANVDASGQGQDFNFEGGLVTTPDSAFINYNGTDYEVDRSIYDQIKSQIERAAANQQQQQQSGAEFLEQLGIDDPNELLTNVTNEGEEDVEGATTSHISGDLDVDRAIEAFKELLRNPAVGALGANTQLPSAAQLEQVKQAIKEAHFDIYVGTDDDIVRRFTLRLLIEPPAGTGVGSIDIDFDLVLGAVNEDQSIEAPSGARPLSDLLRQFGIDPSSLGALGGALGGGAGGGGTTPDPTPGAGASQDYLDCVAQAQDAADLEKCAAP
jgi:hypothetical protein